MNIKLSKIIFQRAGKEWLVFIFILIIGLYLRFYGIQETVQFGWDQGRDAEVVRNILHGKFTFIGPRTGIGHFHLGPVYYYMLAPFYYFANLDPMASNYFNFVANIINFVIIFIVTKKIFNNRTALFVITIYAASSYLMGSRIPWNVTLMPGISMLIFFSIYKVYQGNYLWIIAAWLLSGFFFNLHFTAIFLPPILILSFIFVKDKLKTIKYTLLSLPFYTIWFVPNLIHEIQNYNSDYYRLLNFWNDYYIGFHFRFMLHRLPEAFIQFSAIINHPPVAAIKYIVPLIFLVVTVFFGKKKERLFAYLISLWFIIPLIGFTIYGGPLSDYYFLSSAPIVLLIIGYLQDKIFKLKIKPLYFLLLILLGIYIFLNTKESWVKPKYGGLTAQKDNVRNIIQSGGNKNYTEGDIESYLYNIWTEDNKKF